MATHSDVLAAVKVAGMFPGSKILPNLRFDATGVGFCVGCGHCTVNVDESGKAWHWACKMTALGL